MNRAMVIEAHLTYDCNLRCAHCNRGVGLGNHTPDLTLEQWEMFLASIPAWLKVKGVHVLFTGGEPTLLPNLHQFIEMTHRAMPPMGVAGVERCGQSGNVWMSVASNETTDASRAVLADVYQRYGVLSIGSNKRAGVPSKRFVTDMFLSPVDSGERRDYPCEYAWRCGVSVDAGGMTLCPCGGMIDGILRLGLRTWDWDELTHAHLMRLCAHCGRGLGGRGKLYTRDREPACEIVDVHGFRLTREWKEAVERCG
jgi:hypothetical protein